MAYEDLKVRYQATLDNKQLIITEISPEIYMRYGEADSSDTKQGAIEKLRRKFMDNFQSAMNCINWQAREFGL